MPKPRTELDWALHCYDHRVQGIAPRPLMCCDCARAYADQRVAEALERVAQAIAPPIDGSSVAEIQAVFDLRAKFAAAIRALKKELVT